MFSCSNISNKQNQRYKTLYMRTGCCVNLLNIYRKFVDNLLIIKIDEEISRPNSES